MTDTKRPQRPAVMDELSSTQLKELEFQAEEYDKEQFFDISETYGWSKETVAEVWAWFEVEHKYPLDGTKPTK